MALDNIPSFLSTAGVDHDSATLRVGHYQSTNGNSGVGGPSHLKVTAQSTPTGSVRVAPGTAVAVSRYPGVVGESYFARNVSTTNVTIAPTTSSGKRSDAVILRIDDAGLVAQPPPAQQLQTYSYVKLQVIQGVSASLDYANDLNLAYPFVLLARIDLPASTSAVTSAMITDLREVANPREKLVVRTNSTITAAETHQLMSTNAYPVGQYWPRVGGTDDGAIHKIRVPEWATQAEIRADYLALAVDKSIGNGQMWVTYDLVVQNNPAYRTSTFRWSSEDTTQRQNWVVVDTVSIPANYRGQMVNFALRARRDQSLTTGYVKADTHSGVSLSIRFQERAD